MIGVITGLVYFGLILVLNKKIFIKSKYYKTLIMICIILSFVQGCIFVLLYDNQNTKEIISCVYIIISMMLLDKFFEYS